MRFFLSETKLRLASIVKITSISCLWETDESMRFVIIFFRTMESLMSGNLSLTAADNYDENEDKDLDPEDLGNYLIAIYSNSTPSMPNIVTYLPWHVVLVLGSSQFSLSKSIDQK